MVLCLHLGEELLNQVIVNVALPEENAPEHREQILKQIRQWTQTINALHFPNADQMDMLQQVTRIDECALQTSSATGGLALRTEPIWTLP